MRRIACVAIALVLLGCGLAYAVEVTGSVETREGYTSTLTTAADNNVIKAAPGVLARIKVSGGTLGDMVVYDNTTCAGTLVDNVVTADLADGQNFEYGRKMTTGICVYTSSAMKLLVVYK